MVCRAALPRPQHIWQGCQDPPHRLEEGDARVCAPRSPPVTISVQWQLEAPSQGLFLLILSSSQEGTLSLAARRSAAPGGL